MKNKNPGTKSNRNILFITYIMAALFCCLGLYLTFFLQVGRDSAINNSYNARLDHFSERVVRGKIFSRDGQVLAETRVDEEGAETRVYPYGRLFSHVVGYSTKGKTGLEELGNFYLLTSHVNPAEQIVNQLYSVKNPGDNIVTTLDSALQKAAYDALGDRRGAVAVMEPGTGKVLAMVSKPDFDPNTLDADWEFLISADNTGGQLLNRAAQGLYPPGSTFKIVTALEYLREHPADYQDYRFDCGGVYKNGEYSIRCYHGTAHGRQDLTEAFANSCNGAFAGLGLELDLRGLKELSGELLFNAELPLELAHSKSSYVMDEGAGTWEILQTSIGQGATQMTPVHSLMLVSAVANGGILMKPYLVERVESVGGETVKQFTPSAYKSLMTPEESEKLTRLMEAVVTEGTGSAVRTEEYTAAGKTGSAEFDKDKETHAWFVGFAPVENPQIAVCVLVEEGGSGGAAAGPVARAVFDAFFHGAS